MPRKSTVKQLPPSVVNAINYQLEKERLTLDDIVEWLAREHGYEISRSSMGRYAKKYGALRDEMRKSREITEAFARELGPEAVEGKQGRLLVEMFNTLIFRILSEQMTGPKDTIEGEEDKAFDTKQFMELGRALKDVMQANRLSQDFAHKEIERARKEEREKAAAAVEEVASTVKDKGLSDDTVQAIKAQILGVDPPAAAAGGDG